MDAEADEACRQLRPVHCSPATSMLPMREIFKWRSPSAMERRPRRPRQIPNVTWSILLVILLISIVLPRVEANHSNQKPIIVAPINPTNPTNLLKCYSCASSDYEFLWERNPYVRQTKKRPRFSQQCQGESVLGLPDVDWCHDACLTVMEFEAAGGGLNFRRDSTFRDHRLPRSALLPRLCDECAEHVSTRRCDA